MQVGAKAGRGAAAATAPRIGRSHDIERSLMIEIRREETPDRDAVYRLNRAAFNDVAEAKVVDQLRDACTEYLAFVAVQDDTIVGHILFTPVTVDGCAVAGMGLAPMAVAPSHQRQSIGSQLVHHGLEHLRRSGCPFVVVLGHPEYYPRFGFEPASGCRLRSQWDDIPDEAFLVLVFDDAVLPDAGGVARYRDEFDAAM